MTFDILNSSAVKPGRVDLNLTTTTANVVTAAANTAVYIVSAFVSNVDGTNAADVTIDVYSSTANTTTHIASTVSVPADASLVPVTKEFPVWLLPGDVLRATASADNDLEMICSYHVFEE